MTRRATVLEEDRILAALATLEQPATTRAIATTLAASTMAVGGYLRLLEAAGYVACVPGEGGAFQWQSLPEPTP